MKLSILHHLNLLIASHCTMWVSQTLFRFANLAQLQSFTFSLTLEIFGVCLISVLSKILESLSTNSS